MFAPPPRPQDEARPWTGCSSEITRIKHILARVANLPLAAQAARSAMRSNANNHTRSNRQGPAWSTGVYGGRIAPFACGSTVLTSEIDSRPSTSATSGSKNDNPGVHHTSKTLPDSDYPFAINTWVVDTVNEFVAPTAAVNANLNALVGFILQPGLVVRHSQFELKSSFRSLMEDHWTDVIEKSVRSFALIGIAVGVLGYHDTLGRVLRILHPTQISIMFGIDHAGTHRFRVRARATNRVLNNTVVFVRETPLAGGEIQSPMRRMLLAAMRLRLCEVLAIHSALHRAMPPLAFAEVPFPGAKTGTGAERAGGQKKSNGNSVFEISQGSGQQQSSNIGAASSVDLHGPRAGTRSSVPVASTSAALHGNSVLEKDVPVNADTFVGRLAMNKHRAKLANSSQNVSYAYDHRIGSDMQEVYIVHQPYTMLPRERPEGPSNLAERNERFFNDTTAQFGLPYSSVRNHADSFKPNDETELRRMYQVATATAAPLEKHINEVLRLMWGDVEKKTVAGNLQATLCAAATDRMSGSSTLTGLRASKNQENLQSVFEGRRDMQTDAMTDEMLGIDARLLHIVRHGVAHIMRLSHLVAFEDEEDPASATVEHKHKHKHTVHGQAILHAVHGGNTENSEPADAVSSTHNNDSAPQNDSSVLHNKETTVHAAALTPTSPSSSSSSSSSFARKAGQQVENKKNATKDRKSKALASEITRLNKQVEEVLAVVRTSRRQDAFWRREMMLQADNTAPGAPTSSQLQGIPSIQSKKDMPYQSSTDHGHSMTQSKHGSGAQTHRSGIATKKTSNDPRDASALSGEHSDGLYVTLLLMDDSRRVNTIEYTRAQTERSQVYLAFLRAQRDLNDVENGADPRCLSAVEASTSNLGHVRSTTTDARGNSPLSTKATSPVPPSTKHTQEKLASTSHSRSSEHQNQNPKKNRQSEMEEEDEQKEEKEDVEARRPSNRRQGKTSTLHRPHVLAEDLEEFLAWRLEKQKKRANKTSAVSEQETLSPTELSPPRGSSKKKRKARKEAVPLQEQPTTHPESARPTPEKTVVVATSPLKKVPTTNLTKNLVTAKEKSTPDAASKKSPPAESSTGGNKNSSTKNTRKRVKKSQ
jgi:hypothetical protein